MSGTFPYGYGGEWLTFDQLDRRRTVAELHPEFRRRLYAMMAAADVDGVDLGIGQGSRSTRQQEATFRARYTPHPTPPGIPWSGSWWRKRPGVASAAPPGLSYHEDDLLELAGGALAADMVGDLTWMNANAARFGLVHFANVNGEPWHVQPAEIPRSRRLYDPTQHLLTPSEDDMASRIWKPHERLDTRKTGLPMAAGQTRTVTLPRAAWCRIRVTAIALPDSDRGHVRVAPDAEGLADADAVANIDADDRVDSSETEIPATDGTLWIHATVACHVKVSVVWWAP